MGGNRGDGSSTVKQKLRIVRNFGTTLEEFRFEVIFAPRLRTRVRRVVYVYGVSVFSSMRTTWLVFRARRFAVVVAGAIATILQVVDPGRDSLPTDCRGPRQQRTVFRRLLRDSSLRFVSVSNRCTCHGQTVQRSTGYPNN